MLLYYVLTGREMLPIKPQQSSDRKMHSKSGDGKMKKKKKFLRMEEKWDFLSW